MSASDVPAEETQSASEGPGDGARPEVDDNLGLLRGDPGRYEIIAEHGRGGLGRVSRAHDRSLGRDVAIKELIKPSPLAELRFLREALITARLEHPGIVPVHEAGRWPDGTPFYAMKLVSGRPLRDLIRERPTVAARLELLQHVIAVADAIAYAHGKAIIHRDLKPANVIVGEFGETIVIDWGLAKDLVHADDERGTRGTPDPEDRAPPELTSTGMVLGTPAYMAPEQARGEHVDQRADVFAIGAMLWELCSVERVPPLDLALRHRLLEQAGIDRDLAVIIDKAIDPDPARRYPDAGALTADLKAFKAGARIAARSYSLPQMLAHWTRRHRALTGGAIAFAGVLVASVIALAVLYNASERNAAESRSRLIQAYVEQGRRLSLDGEYLRALPYLAEAYAAGDRSTAVQVLLARAEHQASTTLTVHHHAVMQTGRINDRGISARFRPDGTVISASELGEAAIWDPTTGRDRATLPADPRCQPCYQRISDDGQFVAIGSKAGVTIWNGAPRLLATGPVNRLAIDPRGERLAVAHGTTMTVWRVATGEQLWTASTAQPIGQLAWTGDAIVVGLNDLTAQVVTADHRTSLALEGPIYTFTVGPRGTIATTSDGRVDLWDAAGAHLRTIDVHVVAPAVEFSADEERLVLAKHSTVQIFSQHGRQLDVEFTAHPGELRGLSLSHDGTRLATVGDDQSIKIWRLADQQLRVTLLGARNTYTLAAPQFDATDARLVAATGRDVRVFAISDPDAATTVIGAERLDDARLLTDGRFATSGDHGVQLWSTETGVELAHLARPANSRNTISRDGRWLASYVYAGPSDRADGDAVLELYDVAARVVRQRIPGPAADAAAFSRDGTKLAMAGADHGVDIWSTNGVRLAQLHGHTARVSMTSFDPDDRLLSLSRDGTIRIWALSTGQTLAQTATPTTLRFAAFSASGRRVVSVERRLAWIYDATTLAPLGTFEHEGRVMWADLSPDDQLLVTGTVHGAVDIWDATTGAVLAEFHHGATAKTVTFSADGTRVLSASADKTAAIWRIDRETRPAAIVSAFVRCHAPYRLVETRLEPAEPVCE